LLGDFEDANDAGAVVVDAWAGEDGVGVAADDENGVLVAADCFGDDVLTISRLVLCIRNETVIVYLHCNVVEIALNVQSCLNSSTTGDGVDP
jgi:hypothetical protein